MESRRHQVGDMMSWDTDNEENCFERNMRGRGVYKHAPNSHIRVIDEIQKDVACGGTAYWYIVTGQLLIVW